MVASLLAPAGAGAAEEHGFEALLGTWWQNDWLGIEIGADAVAMITPDSRWVVDAETCPVAHEYTLALQTAADITAFYGLDPAAGEAAEAPPRLVDEDGTALDGRVLAALPPGDDPVPTVWSYCAGETHGGSLYLPAGDGTLTAIATGDGIAAVETYHREPPPPSNEAFSAFQREQVQMALAERGLYDGPIDGVLGPGSRQAIRDWQAGIGAEATGDLSWRQYLSLIGIE